MTYQEMDALVEQGTWIEEYLGSNYTEVLSKNINKFLYFSFNAKHLYPGNGGVVALTCATRQLYHRDYINSWEFKCNHCVIAGNFGDGTSMNITQVEELIDEGHTTIHIHGYRPKRKTIYIYKKPIRDTNIYLASSLDELLYTVDDKKIAVKKVGE